MANQKQGKWEKPKFIKLSDHIMGGTYVDYTENWTHPQFPKRMGALIS